MWPNKGHRKVQGDSGLYSGPRVSACKEGVTLGNTRGASRSGRVGSHEHEDVGKCLQCLDQCGVSSFALSRVCGTRRSEGDSIFST